MISIANKMMLLLIILVSTSCISKHNNNNNNNEEIRLKNIIEGVLGEKLNVPDNVKVYKPLSEYKLDSTEMFSSNFKIYSHVNVSCGTCVRNIDLWNSFIAELKKYDIPIILICSSNDNYVLLEYVCEREQKLSFEYPFILDTKNEFLKKNQFMNECQDFKTVLTNKDDEILLIGNPINNKGIKNIYLKYLNKEL